MEEKKKSLVNKIGSIEFANISDSKLFEEVAKRLQASYQRVHGLEMLFGAFTFIIHGGEFLSIEENSKYRIYNSSPLVPSL